MYHTLLEQELHTVPEVQEVATVGVLEEVKELAFSATSKNRVSTSVVSGSVVEADRITLVSLVYKPLETTVLLSSLSWESAEGVRGV